MNLPHCSLDLLTLTCRLFCYHPYGNTIVTVPCNMIVVVYVANTQVTLLTTCRCGSELHMHSLTLTRTSLWDNLVICIGSQEAFF